MVVIYLSQQVEPATNQQILSYILCNLISQQQAFLVLLSP